MEVSEGSPGPIVRSAIAELLPTLSCDGPLSVEEVSLSPASSQALTRLLAGDDVCVDDRFHGDTVRLCGRVVLPSAVLASHSIMRGTFLLVRQTLNDLQSCLEDGGTRDGGTVLSQQCVEFLTFIECLAHRYLTADNSLFNRQQVGMELVSQLTGLCDHLGPLEDQLRLLRTPSPTVPLHHLSLQLHWTSLAVHYRLSSILGAAAFVECASRIMSSCLNECTMNFEFCPPPFLPCPCTADLWTLLRRTLDNRPTLTKGFWELLSDHLLLVLHHPPTHSHHTPTHSYPQDGAAQHPVVFVWWVLCRLALLDKPHPLTTPTQLPANNWSFVIEHLLQQTFSGELSEVEMRVCLECAVRLVGVWDVCPQLLFKAWDYTHKHMNDPSSSVGGGGLEWAPTRESTTPKQWLNHIVMVTNQDVQGDWSSFELFLSMLSRVFGRHGNTQSLWKQLKGRVYSKVHRRWVSELSGCGLARVASLYLVLSSVAEHAEVGHKMISTFLALSSHGPLVWKGLLTLILLLLHHHFTVSGLVDKLTPALCNLVDQLSSCDSVWDTIATMLVGSLEAIEMPDAVNLGACNLIGSHLSTLLSRVEGARLSQLLGIIETVGTTLSSLDHPPSACCFGYLEHCILALPAHTSTPPHTLHSTAATGTLLALQWAGITGQRSYPQRLFTEFGCTDSTHPYVSSGYLCHIISNPHMAGELLSSQHNQLSALHTWLRCLLVCHIYPLSCDSHVTELTRLLPRLPIVASFIQEPLPTDPLTLLGLILSHMRGRHYECVGSEWREGVETILGDLLKIMTPSLQAGPPQAIQVCYAVAGVVVRSCAQLIYSRINSRCLLPQLVDRLVLPLATNQSPCIRSHLHYFLEGLLCLDPLTDDFIKRKLRDLIGRYFLSYCTPSTSLTASLNPFKTLVERWTGDTVSEQRREQLVILLDTITAECLQLPQQPASLLHVLVYMREMVSVLQCPVLMAAVCVCLLPSLLSCLLACDVCTQGTEPRGIRRQVMSTLRPLLQSCDSTHTIRLIELLRVFVSGNKSRCDAVMTTLSAILPLYPPLTTPTLEYLRQIVRGNQTLTNIYQQLNAKVAHLCKL